MKELILYIEPPDTKVLGVFGNDVRLQTHGYITDEKTKEDKDILHCTLVLSKENYLELWDKWLTGKKDYCERYNSYCDVMGYFHPINPILIGTQKINKWNESNEDYDIIEVSVYKADKFTEIPDFEHG